MRKERPITLTPVDTIALTCTLSRWRGDQQRCRWCNTHLRYPRRVWCGEGCQLFYQMNHVWAIAKIAARNRDGGCVDCGTSRRLNVDHDPACEGVRTQSCAHHQDRLATRCEQHHQARHREIATKSYQS